MRDNNGIQRLNSFNRLKFRQYCLLFLWLSFLLMSTEFLGQDKVKANALLDAVAEKVETYDNINIDFTWNLVNLKEQVDQKTEGSITIKGELYKLSMMGITRIFDGNKLYTIAPEDFEITISDLDIEEDTSVTPSKLMTFYKKGYTYSLDIKQKIGDRTIQYIKLHPIDAKVEIKHILLGIDLANNHIHKLIQTDSKGTKFILTVKSFRPNEKIGSDTFNVNLNWYQGQGFFINTLY